MSYIVKSLSSKVDKNGFSQVLFAIRIGSDKRIRTRTGIFVPVKHWNAKKADITIPRALGPDLIRELKSLKEKIDEVEKRTLKLVDIFGDDATKGLIEEMLELLKDVPGIITADIVNDVLMEQKRKEQEKAEAKRQTITVFDYCDKFIAKGYSEPRIRHWKVLFRCMSRYCVYRDKVLHRPFTWSIEDTRQDDIEDFFDYLANEHVYRIQYAKIFEDANVMYIEKNKNHHKTPRIEERGENRLVDLRKGSKTFWNWLIKTNVTKNQPFLGIEIGVQIYGTPYYMTMEERNIVFGHDFSANKSLEIQRDIFVLQCLTGCRIGDYMHLSKANIVNGVLIYVPHKTKEDLNPVTARVPLSEQALTLIHKYEGQDKKGRLMPFIAEQNYNDAIKEILKECKIERMVPIRNPKTGIDEMKPLYTHASSHMARRTFVGNAYKVVQDPNLIGKMSGHVEGSKAFARYRDIDDSMLEEIIKKFQ